MRWAATATKDTWGTSGSNRIPIPWPKLASIIRIRGGSAGVVIAAPGVGKTTWLLNWVTRAGMPALFISSDTSPYDLTSQLGALATGEPRAQVELRLKQKTWRQEYGNHIATKYPNLVLDFTSRPSIEDIRTKAYALRELWGLPPQMIVMDTASNVAMKDMSDNAEWQRVWLESIALAREFGLFFCFAHHVKQGPARSGRVAPEMSDGLWGSDTFAEYVMALYSPKPNTVDCMIRKNRNGRKDVRVRFDADLARASLTEETS